LPFKGSWELVFDLEGGKVDHRYAGSYCCAGPRRLPALA
jgi:hypothetical protein